MKLTRNEKDRIYRALNGGCFKHPDDGYVCDKDGSTYFWDGDGDGIDHDPILYNSQYYHGDDLRRMRNEAILKLNDRELPFLNGFNDIDKADHMDAMCWFYDNIKIGDTKQ